MTELPSIDLQVKAAEERRKLHNSVEELRDRVHDELDVRKVVRARLGTICSITAGVALGAGYVVAGAFVRH